jgi:hypothetical protein
MEASQLRGRIVERAPLSLEQIFVARTNAVDQEG